MVGGNMEIALVISLYTWLLLFPLTGLMFLAARRERQRTRVMVAAFRKRRY